MITREEVKKLAELARLEVAEDSLETLAGQLGTILEYVGQINSALTQADFEVDVNPKNILRDDVVVNTVGEYTNSLIALSPDSENQFVKVKKIM